jgi:hypothetical protein
MIGTQPNERILKMKLTEKQAKQVIEYFAQQAAEDMPDGTEMECEKHLWTTLFQVSLAVQRRISERDWKFLVDEMLDLQSVNRDAEGYLNERGYETYTPETIRLELEDNVSWLIDNCYDNSGA